MILVDSDDQIFVCKDCNEANETVDALRKAGYKDSEITMIITSGETVLERYKLDNPPKFNPEP